MEPREEDPVVVTGRAMVGVLVVAQMTVEALLLVVRPPTAPGLLRPLVVVILLRALHARRPWAHRAALVAAGLSALACGVEAAREPLREPRGLALLAFALYHAAALVALASPPVRAYLRAGPPG